MALTAATKTTTRTEYCAPGRVTSVNGGASAGQCSSISTTTRRAPLRPTRADWPRYCSGPGANSGSCILGHERRVVFTDRENGHWHTETASGRDRPETDVQDTN